MERLTQWFGYGSCRVAGIEHHLEEKHTAEELIDILATRLAAYEDTGLEPETIRGMVQSILNLESAKGFDYLKHLVDADANGRLVVLPCKVGDTVFRLVTPINGPATITEIKVKSLNQAAGFVGHFGKKHFLISHYATREEAEAALAESARECSRE